MTTCNPCTNLLNQFYQSTSTFPVLHVFGWPHGQSDYDQISCSPDYIHLKLSGNYLCIFWFVSVFALKKKKKKQSDQTFNFQISKSNITLFLCCYIKNKALSSPWEHYHKQKEKYCIYRITYWWNPQTLQNLLPLFLVYCCGAVQPYRPSPGSSPPSTVSYLDIESLW